MQIEDYFNFLAEDDIRIKGTRIGIASILHEHIYNCLSPEEIDQLFHTVTLEQVYATILYFLQNQQKVSAYFADNLEYSRKVREEYEKNPPPVVVRLRELKAKRQTVSDNSNSKIPKDSSASTTPSPSKNKRKQRC